MSLKINVLELTVCKYLEKNIKIQVYGYIKILINKYLNVNV